MIEITVEELAEILAEGDSIQLIDVREPEEVAIAHLPQFTVLPLSQFQQWATQISTRFDPDRETVVMCHHGIRSAQMCQWLLQQGFSRVKNVSGGIDAYAIKIDRNIARY